MRERITPPWALILVGGGGTRLRPLTMQVAGDSRPKQFDAPPMGFSETVLVPGTRHLAVLRVKGVEWSDWGHPRRVLASLGRAGLRPAWLDRVQLAEVG
ncbi:MAG TPA: hypothetical protein VGQ77_01275 [Methylomirabilota bacterium]|jgi:hypothetical protein|nr:hypothetical protein [Methylomirabilota bacterium]